MPFGIVEPLLGLHKVAVLKHRVWLQITLRGYECLDDVYGAVLLDLRHPTVEVQEGAAPGAVIGQEDAVAPTEVLHR